MLLEAEDLRVDVDGVPAVEGLSLRLSHDRAIVAGAPRALLEAVSGARPVVRGRLRVAGEEPAAAARASLVAAVPHALAVPPKWTATEYVTWNARLAGASPKEAAERATAAIARLELTASARTRLDRLPAAGKRATAVAAALATGAKTLLLEDPALGLPEDVALTFAGVLAKALASTSWIAFVARIPLASPFTQAAGEAAIVSGAEVEAQGPPAELGAKGRRLSLRVVAPAEATAGFVARLAERGGRADAAGTRLVVDLGETLTTAEVLGLAVEAKVVVTDLLPLARALA